MDLHRSRSYALVYGYKYTIIDEYHKFTILIYSYMVGSAKIPEIHHIPELTVPGATKTIREHLLPQKIEFHTIATD